MENIWQLRESMGARKTFTKLRHRIDKYCKQYVQEVYYYEFDEKIIKGLRVDSSAKLEDQMAKLCLKLKLDAGDLESLQKVYVKFFTIKQAKPNGL